MVFMTMVFMNMVFMNMVFKLVQAAEKKWRLLNGSPRIPDVIQKVRFINGAREEKAAA